MAVDWNAMWPYIAGGFIISLAISINVALTKRMISLSTIFHDLLSPERPEFTWKAGILGGLIFTSALLWNVNGYGEIKNTNIVPFETQSSFFSGLGIYGFMFAGLLVGLGTRIAGGGITGHAFCGIPRLSVKSIIAVPIFLGTAFLVATMKSKSTVLTANGMDCASLDVSPSVTANIFLAASAILFVYSLFKNPDRHNIISTVVSFGAGAALGLGLIISGMAQRTRFLEFLTFKDSWNSSFIFVFVCAIVGNLITFNLFLRHKFDGHLKQPHIFNVIIGSILFGGGLGLSGMTPGTALVVAPVYFPEVLVFFLLPAAFGHTLAGYVIKVSEAVRGAAAADDLYGQF